MLKRMQRGINEQKTDRKRKKKTQRDNMKEKNKNSKERKALAPSLEQGETPSKSQPRRFKKNEHFFRLFFNRAHFCSTRLCARFAFLYAAVTSKKPESLD